MQFAWRCHYWLQVKHRLECLVTLSVVQDFWQGKAIISNSSFTRWSSSILYSAMTRLPKPTADMMRKILLPILGIKKSLGLVPHGWNKYTLSVHSFFSIPLLLVSIYVAFITSPPKYLKYTPLLQPKYIKNLSAAHSLLRVHRHCRFN